MVIPTMSRLGPRYWACVEAPVWSRLPWWGHLHATSLVCRSEQWFCLDMTGTGRHWWSTQPVVLHPSSQLPPLGFGSWSSWKAVVRAHSPDILLTSPESRQTLHLLFSHGTYSDCVELLDNVNQLMGHLSSIWSQDSCQSYTVYRVICLGEVNKAEVHSSPILSGLLNHLSDHPDLVKCATSLPEPTLGLHQLRFDDWLQSL